MTDIAWGHDLQAALDRAKSENKLVLVDVFNPG